MIESPRAKILKSYVIFSDWQQKVSRALRLFLKKTSLNRRV